MSVSVLLDGELLYPSKYIGAADCKGRDVTLTIANVQVDELMLAGGRKHSKPVLYFERTEKMLVLNKTNATTIANAHGSEARQWIGKRITLYPTTTKCKGKTVPCVRVREIEPTGNTPDHIHGTDNPADSTGLSDADKAAILAREAKDF